MVQGNIGAFDSMPSNPDWNVSEFSRPRAPRSTSSKACEIRKNPWALSKRQTKKPCINETSSVEYPHVDGLKGDEEPSSRTIEQDLEDVEVYSKDGFPLSDPRSWIWKKLGDANFAVVIDSGHSMIPETTRYLPDETSESSIPVNGGDALPDKSKRRLCQPKIEIPLLPVTSSRLNLHTPLKDTTIERFFITKPAPNISAVNSKLHHIEENSTSRTRVIIAPRRGSYLDELKNATEAKHNKTLLNSSNRVINMSSRPTRVPRAARSKLSVYTETTELSDSSEDDSLTSELTPSAFASDAFSEAFGENASINESATVSEPADEVDTSDEEIVPSNSRKRQKSARSSPANKRIKRRDLDVDEPRGYFGQTGDIAVSIRPKPTGKRSANDSQATDNYSYRVGIDESLQPLCKINEIFVDMTERACKLGFKKVVNHLKSRKLKVATMCSGTESPILALQLISDALKQEGMRLEIQHEFSSEIVPFKQSYIYNNFGAEILRDVRDFSKENAMTATTAFGAVVQIPGDLDLLVAGFSCVDFSGLNNKRKTLEAGGESGDTFQGIRDYANRWRPKIIILENVSSAPWDNIRDTAMVEIGYRAQYIRVDTKEYYLPHTRVRGYMICIDAREYHDPNGVNHIPKDPKLIASVLKTWVDTMDSFKRPASCSIEAFLLDEDDPRLNRAREELSDRDSTRSRVIDWACCHGRHQDYRMALSLGSKRPSTKWVEGGFCEPLDFMWIDFIRAQPERVQDMIDIAFLRNLYRGLDHHYKTRILELSQNVDRVTDNIKAGVTGCITPTGIPFSTTRGGPLTGLEVLSIQGLPIDRLQLTRQKQSQLQDLAGNAMSSTVVGAAILAALIAGYQHLPTKTDLLLEDDTTTPLSLVCAEQNLTLSTISLSNYEPLSVSAALQAAKHSVRLCICEGPLNVTSMPLQKCTLCQHTACIKCSGNPFHAYSAVSDQILLQRIPPNDFAANIRRAIPMIVSFAGVSDEFIAKLSQNYKDEIEIADWNISLAAIRKAFKSEPRFYSIKRSEIWTIQYESGDARLDLVISSYGIEWRLFARPPRKDAANSRLRQLLSHPIARMVPKGNDIMQGTWQLWLPKVHKFTATFSGHGGLASSYEDRVGLVKFLDIQVWKEYSISIPEEARELLDVDISGNYKLIQDCGTAFGMLHIQTKTIGTSQPVFMFLDPHRLHHPDKDFFIFSTNKRRLNYRDARYILARVNPNWRPQKLEELKDSSTGNMRYKINGSQNLVTLADAQMPKTVDCYVDGRWVDIPNASFELSRNHGGLSCLVASALPLLPSPSSCRKARVVFLGEARLPERQTAPWSQNRWVEISPIDYSEFFKSHAWLTEKACTLESLASWSNAHTSFCTLCSNCAPSAPMIKWKLQAQRFGKKAINGDESSANKQNEVLKYFPFEDPEEAAMHEHLLKNRPSPIVTQIFINEAGTVQLKLAINPETLMHRALAKLCLRQNISGVTLKWRLITAYSVPSRPSLPSFILKDNKSDSEANSPSGFLFPLRPEQARSLTWMISQESGQGQKFREEETEEALIPQIRWRVESRAERDVFVRGGILADQVGYGKTVTTLALVASQRSYDTEAGKLPVKGCIALKATLILVPSQLPDQWNREVKKFLHQNQKYKVLVIKNLAALQNKTIAQFQEADIIIASWKLCEGNSYLFKIAQFAGMVELSEKSSSRASSVWYKAAMTAFADHVDELKRGGKGLNDMITRKLAENQKKATEAVTIVPSKRLRGQAYQAAKEDAAPGSKRKNGQKRSSDGDAQKQRPDVFGLEEIERGKLKWTDMRCPLLELFSFARVVVDEYTYVTGQEGLTIAHIQARCRWILSATPSLVDFTDVKNIAKFLGVHLGIDDITPGITKFANIKALEKEKTDAELFQSFQQSQSPAWHERRHAVAQRFLNQFARQNIADIRAIQGSEHIWPVILPAAERAIYLENSQNLLLNDLNIRKGRKNVDNDRSRRFQELASQSATAGEILMKCASHFTLDDTVIDSQNALEACKRIVTIRDEQSRQLKDDFRKKLKQAVWLDGECTNEVEQYISWKKHVHANGFGDLESTKQIEDLISKANRHRQATDWRDFYITAQEKVELDKKDRILRINKKTRTKRQSDSDSEFDSERPVHKENRRVKPGGMDDKNRECAGVALREVTIDLRRLSAEFVNRQRCLRFFDRVRELQQFYANQEENAGLRRGFACSKCGKDDLSPESISILCQCGHIICNDCLEFRKNGLDECVAPGCNAVNKPYQIIKANELGVADNREFSEKHYGKKIEDIVALIKNVPEDEQVLLFVQFSDLMVKIASAFNHHKITYSALGESGDPAKKLTEFQMNKDISSMKKVLILNIGDSSAAGSNLTNANHVIFVSPFLTDNDTLFDQAMTQAEGRARRYGQLKHVHVYRFLSLKTIDVDVIQARNRGKYLAKGWASGVEVKPYDSFMASTFALVEEKKGVTNEFGSGEAGNKILGL